MRFTTSNVKTFAVPSGKIDHIEWDDSLPGFGVRVRGNKRSYVCQYRVNGQQRRESLGDVRRVTLQDARDIARKRFAQVELGVDPGAERSHSKTPTLTFGALAQKYLDGNQTRLRPASFKAAARHCRLHWLPLAKRPVAEIKRAEIASQLHVIIKDHGRPSASRARGVLSGLFSWAMKEGLVEANPVIGTNDPGQGKARDRILSDGELVAVWKACEPDDFGKIVRLLILTGCRESEIGSMKWSELDGNVFTIPGDRTKNHRPHTLTLPPLAMQILEGVLRETDFLFGAHGRGFTQWGPDMEKLRKRLGGNVKPWRIHDLRRSFRSGLARLGVRPDIAERAVNHATGNSVSKIYDRYQYGEEIAAALLKWSNHVDDLLNGRNNNNVVPLRVGKSD